MEKKYLCHGKGKKLPQFLIIWEPTIWIYVLYILLLSMVVAFDPALLVLKQMCPCYTPRGCGVWLVWSSCWCSTILSTTIPYWCVSTDFYINCGIFALNRSSWMWCIDVSLTSAIGINVCQRILPLFAPCGVFCLLPYYLQTSCRSYTVACLLWRHNMYRVTVPYGVSCWRRSSQCKIVVVVCI